MSEKSSRPGDAGIELRDGWLTMAQPGGGAIHVRLSNRDGRVVITDLYLHSEEIDSAALRAVNTTKIYAMASALRDDVSVDAASIADTAAELRLEEPTLAELRLRTPRRRRISERVPVTRPIGIHPDVFYPRVAEAYREFAATTGRAAAVAIAAEAGVPVSAAHRWVREARRRGFLPPGVKGKTG